MMQPPRRPRGRLRYTDREWAPITAAAAQVGLRPGAWVQQVAYDAAVAVARGDRLDREAIEDLIAEIREHRRVAANIGGLANQLAASANATGQIKTATAAVEVLNLVRRVVGSSDQLMLRVRSQLLPSPH